MLQIRRGFLSFMRRVACGELMSRVSNCTTFILLIIERPCALASTIDVLISAQCVKGTLPSRVLTYPLRRLPAHGKCTTTRVG